MRFVSLFYTHNIIWNTINLKSNSHFTFTEMLDYMGNSIDNLWGNLTQFYYSIYWGYYISNFNKTHPPNRNVSGNVSFYWRVLSVLKFLCVLDHVMLLGDSVHGTVFEHDCDPSYQKVPLWLARNLLSYRQNKLAKHDENNKNKSWLQCDIFQIICWIFINRVSF